MDEEKDGTSQSTMAGQAQPDESGTELSSEQAQPDESGDKLLSKTFGDVMKANKQTDLWKRVGQVENLSTDADIASFLIALYFSICEQSGDDRSLAGADCVTCKSRLRLVWVCIKCKTTVASPCLSATNPDSSATSVHEDNVSASQENDTEVAKSATNSTSHTSTTQHVSREKSADRTRSESDVPKPEPIDIDSDVENDMDEATCEDYEYSETMAEKEVADETGLEDSSAGKRKSISETAPCAKLSVSESTTSEPSTPTTLKIVSVQSLVDLKQCSSTKVETGSLTISPESGDSQDPFVELEGSSLTRPSVSGNATLGLNADAEPASTSKRIPSDSVGGDTDRLRELFCVPVYPVPSHEPDEPDTCTTVDTCAITVSAPYDTLPVISSNPTAVQSPCVLKPHDVSQNARPVQSCAQSSQIPYHLRSALKRKLSLSGVSSAPAKTSTTDNLRSALKRKLSLAGVSSSPAQTSSADADSPGLPSADTLTNICQFVFPPSQATTASFIGDYVVQNPISAAGAVRRVPARTHVVSSAGPTATPLFYTPKPNVSASVQQTGDVFLVDVRDPRRPSRKDVRPGHVPGNVAPEDVDAFGHFVMAQSVNSRVMLPLSTKRQAPRPRVLVPVADDAVEGFGHFKMQFGGKFVERPQPKRKPAIRLKHDNFVSDCSTDTPKEAATPVEATPSTTKSVTGARRGRKPASKPAASDKPAVPVLTGQGEPVVLYRIGLKVNGTDVLAARPASDPSHIPWGRTVASSAVVTSSPSGVLTGSSAVPPGSVVTSSPLRLVSVSQNKASPVSVTRAQSAVISSTAASSIHSDNEGSEAFEPNTSNSETDVVTVSVTASPVASRSASFSQPATPQSAVKTRPQFVVLSSGTHGKARLQESSMHTCDECDKVFVSPEYLKAHKKSFHPAKSSGSAVGSGSAVCLVSAVSSGTTLSPGAVTTAAQSKPLPPIPARTVQVVLTKLQDAARQVSAAITRSGSAALATLSPGTVLRLSPGVTSTAAQNSSVMSVAASEILACSSSDAQHTGAATVSFVQKSRMPVCEVCGKVFISKKFLTSHMKAFHPELLVKQKVFVDKLVTKRAAPKPKPVPAYKLPPHSCRACKAEFSSRSELINHHNQCALHEQKKSQCEKCGKSFSNRTYLKCHQVEVHGGPPRHVCEICHKGFHVYHHLNVHMNKVHLKSRSFLCDTCGQSFASRSTWRDHSNIHTGLRPYVCNVCGKCFGHKSVQKSHMLTHSQLKKFACKACGMRFAWACNMRSHYRARHENLPAAKRPKRNRKTGGKAKQHSAEPSQEFPSQDQNWDDQLAKSPPALSIDKYEQLSAPQTETPTSVSDIYPVYQIQQPSGSGHHMIPYPVSLVQRDMMAGSHRPSRSMSVIQFSRSPAHELVIVEEAEHPEPGDWIGDEKLWVME